MWMPISVPFPRPSRGQPDRIHVDHGFRCIPLVAIQARAPPMLEECASTSTRRLEGSADFYLLSVRPFTCTQRGGRLHRWKGDTLRLSAPKP